MKVAIIYNQDQTGVINTFGMQNKEFYSEKNVRHVAECLEQAGHNVRVLDGNMYIIERLHHFMPRVMDGEQMGMVFNMAYGIQGESRYTHIPSMLEMLGLPYVGSNPSGHALALDKVMTKIVWQNQGLPTPDFWVFNSAQDDFSGVRYPVIVKPKMESVSFGLKVVYNEADLQEAVHFIVTEFQQQALVEQFIRGREFCVGILGNNPVETFPVLEIDLEGDPDAIQTVDDKKQKPKRKICPAQLSDELAQAMQKYSVDAFNALGLRDFARVDIRLDENNNIYLLEINSMASLGVSGSYPAAAKVAGYDFAKLVNRMLDVATVRYFSTSFQLDQVSGDKKIKLPLHSRMRTFIRSRQEQGEALLEKMVNMDTYVRNVDGLTRCNNLIKHELTQLGFINEVFPQHEVGNMFYYSNSFEAEVDWLLLLNIDDVQKLSDQESYFSTEHKLYGTGVWENKGGVVTTLLALQALRYGKLLRKQRIGILVTTDSSINGKFSRTILNEKARKASRILSFHGGNIEGSIVASRSGSAHYNYDIKLLDPSAENVASVSAYFYKVLSAIIEISKNNPELVVAPHNTQFTSNIFKGYAGGSAKISVRFNCKNDFDAIDKKIRKLTTSSREQLKLFKSHMEGGVSRLPMQESEANEPLWEAIRNISTTIDVRTTKEHRWSSSDICNITYSCPKLDGFGPIGGYDQKRSEYIMRHSLADRALMLALLLKERP